MPADFSNLYRAPQQVDEYVSKYPDLKVIADQPTAVWLGEWSGPIFAKVSGLVSQAKGKTLLLVAYNIPNRDNGNHSSGGAEDEVDYYSWIGAIGAALGEAPAIIVLEPDAMGLLHELQEPAKGKRLTMLSVACDILKENKNTEVYIDLSTWISPTLAAESLEWSDILSKVDGFTCNVSGYKSLSETRMWADVVGELTGLYYIVDTSRNGKGNAAGVWCNPSGQGLGITPRVFSPARGWNKAALWIKAPGESDGPCNGGPSAGQFWPEKALELVKNAVMEPMPTPTPTPDNELESVWSAILSLTNRIEALEHPSNPEQPTEPSCAELIGLIKQITSIVEKEGDHYKQVQEIKNLLTNNK